jgi:hypothetical protein
MSSRKLERGLLHRAAGERGIDPACLRNVLFRCLDEQRAGKPHGAVGMGAAAGRHDRGVAGHEFYLFRRDAEPVCQHLREGRLMALAARLRAGDRLDFAHLPHRDLHKVESFQTGGHGHVGETVDKTDLSISSATGGAGAGKSRKSKGEQDCQRFACANGKH